MSTGDRHARRQTIRAIIEAATRAPSGHNSQPWQFAVAENHITISPDFSRRLPAVDPDDRELFISLDCTAENLSLAAGNRTQMHDLAFKAELLSWIRFNRRHSNTTRDGLSNAVIGAPNLPAWLSRPIIKTMLNERRQNRSDHQSFAGYAYGQIKKARGLNKKISNPMSSEKKSVLDFCHIVEGAQTVPLQRWLAQREMEQRRVGLVKIAHARELYALFYDLDGTRGYHGVAPKPEATNLSLSSVPEGETPLAYLSFNQDGYSSYCREYASYQQWLAERNETRYQSTQAHGQGYGRQKHDAHLPPA